MMIKILKYTEIVLLFIISLIILKDDDFIINEEILSYD